MTRVSVRPSMTDNSYHIKISQTRKRPWWRRLFDSTPALSQVSAETIARLERRDRMVQDQAEARWDWPSVAKDLRR